MKKNVVLFLAILLASVAAFFSVSGLGKLFAGASMSVIIMASALELTKISIASFLHDYWDKMGKALRYYMVASVVILVLITSLGIYGFLISAYSKTSADIQLIENDISAADNIKLSEQNKIERLENIINSKKDRIDLLSSQRSVQEARLDTLYANRNFNIARRTEQMILDANSEISSLNAEIDSVVSIQNSIYSAINSLDSSILSRKSEISSGEAAPLMYIAKLTNTSMDKVVNILIFLIIFVFDPLAISLMIIYSRISHMESTELKEDIVYIPNNEHITTDKPPIEPQNKRRSVYIDA